MSTRHLQRLKIKNFQSHQVTELELVDGINIITGLEDSGKTALLRAVNWLRTNRPSSDGFKFNKDKNLTTEVELEFYDKILVNHSLGKVNSYTYMNPKAAATEPGSQLFTKVGREVPAPIAEVLRLDEINIQEQFDQPYLVWLTSGELANVFNRLSGMQRFDEWQSEVSAGIKAANAGIKTAANDIGAFQEQMAQFEKLPEVKKLIAEIEQLDKNIASAGKDFNRLRQIETDIKSADTNLKKLAASEEEIAQALAVVAEIRELDRKINSTNNQLGTIEEAARLCTLVGITEEELQAAISSYTELLSKEGICDRCYGNIDKTTIDNIKHRMLND